MLTYTPGIGSVQKERLFHDVVFPLKEDEEKMRFVSLTHRSLVPMSDHTVLK